MGPQSRILKEGSAPTATYKRGAKTVLGGEMDGDRRMKELIHSRMVADAVEVSRLRSETSR